MFIALLASATKSPVYGFTIDQIVGGLLALSAGITTVAAAVAVIAKIIKQIMKPNQLQNDSLQKHAAELEAINRKLAADKDTLDLYRRRFIALEESQKEQEGLIEEHSRRVAEIEQHLKKVDRSNEVVIQALLALLQHGLDGTSVEPMRRAKSALEEYLIHG